MWILAGYSGGDRELQLSSKEYSLLHYMMQNAGVVLSRDKLEQHVWDYDFSGGSNVIDVYIRSAEKGGRRVR